MKKRMNASRLGMALMLLVMVVGIAACGTAPAPVDDVQSAPAEEAAVVVEEAPLLAVDDEGSTEIDVAGLEATVVPSVSGLTAVEVEGLLFMREEEKLARDVYLTLYDEWGLNIFNNIGASEATHTDAVRVLLEEYGLDDPMTTDARGVFVNADLQALYDQLVETGRRSLVDALLVGAAIEEIDILDLEEYIAQTDNADIAMVYDNLLRGSRNHLRAFVRQIESRSGSYQPQYLTQDAYDAILGIGVEPGPGEG